LTAATPREAPPSKIRLCIIGGPGEKLYGKTTSERLRIQFARAGVTDVLPPERLAACDGQLIVVRGDAALDQPLIPVLLASPGLLLMGDGPQGPSPLAAHVGGEKAEAAASLLRGEPAPGLDLVRRTPAEVEADFWKSLRKRETPYAMAVSPANRDAVEWRVFMGTYKGATDLVTKHLWPYPAYLATRWLAPRGITPNMVTILGALLMVLAFWLFLNGQFAWGLVAGWIMTFLDTVDGKLARTTLTSSKVGDILDHGIDLVHPPFWYVAWALGLNAVGIVWSSATFWCVIIAILGGYVVQRVMEGIAIKWLKLEIHIWRKIDTLFRQITARRNPNLILLTLSLPFGRPDLGLMAVAAWTVICLILHGLQLAQALAARRRGPLASWMTRA